MAAYRETEFENEILEKSRVTNFCNADAEDIHP